ncbi:MAG TPA: membrane protein insertase YidC [Kofleriaceae bacterium]
MQEQGKRLILAVGLALGVLLLWQKFLGPKDEPKPPGAGSGSASVLVTAKPSSLVGYDGEAPHADEQQITLKYPSFDVSFSNLGGNVKSWHLTDPRYVGDQTKGQLVADAGELEVGFTKSSTFKLPKNAVWTGTQTNDHQVQYKLSTDALDIVKTFDVVPDAFIVKLSVAITAKKDARQQIAISNYQFQDPKQLGGGSSRIQAREWNSSTLRADGDILQTPLKDVQEHPRFEPNIVWAGWEHPYLLVGFAPKPSEGGTVEKHTYDEKTDGHMRTDLIYQAVDLKPGAPAFTREIAAYFGPKNYDQLNHTDEAAGFSTGFGKTIDLGWFGFLGKRLLWLLIKLEGFVGNWGVAIILLTVLVKLVTLYWMTKSMRSMKAMAVLGPQIKALNEKYAGDKQRIQVETMALYKQNGANPLSGCLPMVLQMPIWIALYRMLSNAGELYRQTFIGGWIDDLTAADPSHVLPVVLVITMFAQARLTPQNPDPAQRTQQKIMQYGMPLLFGGMSWVFPAGLTLYIFTNTCLSALHSIYMNKFDKKSLEIAAKIKAAQDEAAAKTASLAAGKAKNANVTDEDSKSASSQKKKKKGSGK